MNALIDLRHDAQPGYETSVELIARRFEQVLGAATFDGVDRDGFVARAVERLGDPDVGGDGRLQLISDLGRIAWWCGLTLTEAELATLSSLARRTHYEAARQIQFRMERPDPSAKTAHIVFAGAFTSLFHSPTRGAFDYLAALAADPDARFIEVYHAGVLTSELEAFAVGRLGANRPRVRFVSTDGRPDFLSDVIARGACTYHFWCEEPCAIQVSLMSLFGPTVMFTCGDAAPVLRADVYWYCHEPEYIARLWARQSAPARFAGAYRQVQACPFPQDPPARRRTRAELGLRDDEVVLVTVGNRLGVDMDQAFVDGTAGLVAANPHVRWALVGGLQDFWIDAFGQVLGEQFLHIPYEQDLPGLFGLTDIFVNPFRAGGGTSAITAISQGTQVLTRADVGDVGAFVPATHRAPNAGAYFQMLQELVSSPALRAARLAEQQALMAVRLDQDLFARELKNLTALAYDRFARRLPVSLEDLYAQPRSKLQALRGSGRSARLR